MSPLLLLLVYCLLIVLASLVGGWIPLWMRLTHRRMEVALSLVSGVMLGVGLLHLLPEAWHARWQWAALEGLDTDIAVVEPVLTWLLAGFLVMFLIERFVCFHHHEPVDEPAAGPPGHDHDDAARPHGHRLTWAGALVGLTVHSLIAGAALGGSVVAQDQAGPAGLAGLGVFTAIALHKPFDSLTLGTVMAAGGWSTRWRHLVNGLFALAVPVGAGLLLLGLGDEAAWRQWLLSAALAFSAGMFLCISLSDLLPELQFHRHDRIRLSVALVLGLAVAWAAVRLEPHAHGPDEAGSGVSSGHEHVTD